MCPRLLLNLCKRSLYRASNGVRSNITRLSHVASKDEKKHQELEIVSERFPNYKVIYIFPFVKQACGINVTKRRFTILVGATTPVIIGLYLSDILSSDITTVSLASEIIITLWLHTLGILCNNLVGYIYVKLDEEKAILSYIDYWGKRKDSEMPLNEIIPMSDNPISITDPLYRKIMFCSQKYSLKINMKFGRILDDKNFRCILGKV